ncbi:hypothetical protein BGX28_005866 [Mortierella sp. GBA30]|nr:hypothetical protein BGX28_005866 [Mortierella sp. GBA30]
MPPLFLIFLLLAPTLISGQTGVLYQPISSAASAILADGGLYIYGGVVQFMPSVQPNIGTKQFLRVDLTKSFDTQNPPWTSLVGHLDYSSINASPSRDGKQLILGGNKGHAGTVAYIYDIDTKQWIGTPDLPGVPNGMDGYKRGNLGMVLDPLTGLVFMYGGFPDFRFSNELSILDTTESDPNKMQWTLSENQTIIPTLYEPNVLYLPNQKQILVFSGCDRFEISTGFAGNCATLDHGYLISTAPDGKTYSIQRQRFNIGPGVRYLGCRVTLPDGNVFIQGGKDLTMIYGEAWILNTTSWTWQNVTIKGDITQMTRAGHTCQMGPNGQIVVVGGYIGGPDTSTYVQPYMAVIDTNTWTWSTKYQGAALSSIWTTLPLPDKGGSNNNSGGNSGNGKGTPAGSDGAPGGAGLSSGAKGGIGAGVVIGVLGLGAGFFFWKRRKLHDHSKASISTDHSAAHKTHQSGFSSSSLIHIDKNNNDDDNDGNGPIYVVGSTSQSGSTTYTTPGATTAHPVYAGHEADGKTPLESSDHPSPSAVPSNASRSKLGFFSNNSHVKTKTGTPDDAALAAALFQAEDKVSSTPKTPKLANAHPMNTFPSKQDYIPPQSPVYVYNISVQDPSPPSPSQSLSSASIASSPSAQSSSSAPPIPKRPTMSSSSTTVLSRVPTIHTPVISTIGPDGLHNRDGNGSGHHNNQRPLPGPQSVPEHEARIERSSPGVKSHMFRAMDVVDKDGFYPPLTPTRLQSPTSILVGSPVSAMPSTGASFSAAVVAPRGLRTNKRSQSSLAGQNAGEQTGEGTAGGIGYEGHDGSSSNQNRGPQSPPQVYRDPQMMKDVSDIQEMIFSESLAEPKGPHAVVNSYPGKRYSRNEP